MDCIRTATSSFRTTKYELVTYRDAMEAVIHTDLAHSLGRHIAKSFRPTELNPEPGVLEYRQDITILVPREPDPESQEGYLLFAQHKDHGQE